MIKNLNFQIAILPRKADISRGVSRFGIDRKNSMFLIIKLRVLQSRLAKQAFQDLPKEDDEIDLSQFRKVVSCNPA